MTLNLINFLHNLFYIQIIYKINNINPKIEDLFDNFKIGGFDTPELKRSRSAGNDKNLLEDSHFKKYSKVYDVSKPIGAVSFPTNLEEEIAKEKEKEKIEEKIEELRIK